MNKRYLHRMLSLTEVFEMGMRPYWADGNHPADLIELAIAGDFPRPVMRWGGYAWLEGELADWQANLAAERDRGWLDTVKQFGIGQT